MALFHGFALVSLRDGTGEFFARTADERWRFEQEQRIQGDAVQAL
jgi:hypothetical protein